MSTSFVGAHKAFFGLLIIVATSIVAFQTVSYYYYSKSSSDCPNPCLGSGVAVEVLINYGNGTWVWINKTDIPSSWNFYQLTTSVVTVQAQPYGSEHFVTGINGLQSNQQYFWSLWAVCQKSSAWTATNVGADAIRVTAYHVFAWYYQRETSQDSSSWNPPIPGAAKVASC